MKALLNLILVACLFSAVPKILAADSIGEHFGLKMGAVFDPARAVTTNAPNELADEPRELEYQVASTNVIKPFETLLVQITPTTHKIYRIIARGTEITEEEKRDAMADLQQKFPVSDRAIRKLGFRTFRSRGGNGVSGNVISQDTITEAAYTALEFQELAIRERTEKQVAARKTPTEMFTELLVGTSKQDGALGLSMKELEIALGEKEVVKKTATLQKSQKRMYRLSGGRRLEVEKSGDSVVHATVVDGKKVQLVWK